jgi:nicotinamide mononucleotide transporter
VEVAGALSGALCVYLTVRERVWCWPVGIVNAGLYAVVFGRAKLYSDSALQVVYLLMSCYGWWAWLRGARGSELPVARAPRRVLWPLLGFAAVAALGVGSVLRHRTDAALPWLDAGTTAFSLAAQVLLTRKWIENWVIWIVVDVVYVYMYVVKGLMATAVLYTLFLVLALAGLVEWRRSLARAA